MDWNWMARVMQRRPFFAKGNEEEIEAALRHAAGTVWQERGPWFITTMAGILIGWGLHGLIE